MQYGLEGKVALVTGGSHGIGLATAQVLYEEGCKVAICARGREAMDAFTSGRNWTMGVPFDALDSTTIAPVIEQVLSAYGRLDILVNNIGGGGTWGNMADVSATPMQTWDDVFQKNARAAIEFTMLALPSMRDNLWGRVVTVASIYGKEAGGRPWFTMAKAAEIALMKELAAEDYLRNDLITFNTVAPGHIAIEGKQSDFPVMGRPADVAAAVVFLCSEQARHINGACITVDGGESSSF